jgi:hypothetical protein
LPKLRVQAAPHRIARGNCAPALQEPGTLQLSARLQASAAQPRITHPSLETSMKFISLRAATAVALVLSATAAYAQTQKEQGREAAPGDKGSQVQQQERAPDTGKATTPHREEPKASKGAEKAEPKEKATKGTAQSEPKEKASKGTAQKDVEPKEKATKGAAQSEPKEKATQGAAQKSDTTKEKSAAEKSAPSNSTASKAGTQPRVQLSEQQQTRVRETVLKQRNARVTNVNFSVTVGTRIPRSVRLVALPATVIEVVPEYRSYQYVVVGDDIVIVDPGSYEIVYVLPGRSTTAGGSGGPAALALSDEQVAFVLRNIDLKSDGRLGIGGISVGATLGREVELREFPVVVVEKLPELRSYRYLVHENDIAFVDPRDSKVVLVKDNRH